MEILLHHNFPRGIDWSPFLGLWEHKCAPPWGLSPPEEESITF